LSAFFGPNIAAKESILETYLHSVESKVPRIVFIGLREVARVRNKLSHKLEFGPDSIPPGFEELCTEIMFRLDGNDDSPSSGVDDA
jgi:hypothetical protein